MMTRAFLPVTDLAIWSEKLGVKAERVLLLLLVRSQPAASAPPLYRCHSVSCRSTFSCVFCRFASIRLASATPAISSSSKSRTMPYLPQQ